MTEQIWLTAKEAARELDVDSSYVRQLCGQDRIRGAKKLGTAWMIPSPVVVLSTLGDTTSMTPAQAAVVLGVGRERVTQLCKAGLIEGAKRVRGTWSIPTPIKRIVGKPGPRPKDASPSEGCKE